MGLGDEVPHGSFLVTGRRIDADSEVERYFLVDAGSGALTPVPELGERFVQG